MGITDSMYNNFISLNKLKMTVTMKDTEPPWPVLLPRFYALYLCAGWGSLSVLHAESPCHKMDKVKWTPQTIHRLLLVKQHESNIIICLTISCFFITILSIYLSMWLSPMSLLIIIIHLSQKAKFKFETRLILSSAIYVLFNICTM